MEPAQQPTPPPASNRWGEVIALLVLCALVGACVLSFVRPLFGVPTLLSLIGIGAALLVRGGRREAAEAMRREDELRSIAPSDEADALQAVAHIRGYLANGDGTRALGYPDVVQDPMEETCERIARGLSLTKPLDGPLANEVHEASKRWRLLLQVDRPTEGMGWGDGGLLYYWAAEEDLQAGRFDRVLALVQGH